MEDTLRQNMMEKVVEVINEDFGNSNSFPNQKEGNDADDNDVIEPGVHNRVEWIGGRSRVPRPITS